MAGPLRSAVALSSVVSLALLTAACAPDAATAPPAASDRVVAATSLPSGERHFGQVTIEPSYNDVTGSIVYLLTPDHAPNPSHANARATAPLYLVEYPPGADVGTLNCMGVPGNCPDHDLAVATAATSIMPSVYGTDPYALPGHDHLVAPPASGGDFNVAWEVIEVLFTNTAAANTHITTEAQLEAMVASGDVIEVDLGFAFNCSVVPARVYWKGTPLG